MFTKQRLIVGTSIIAVAGLALSVLVLASDRGVAKVSFDQVENGMTIAEVEKIFGMPSERHHAIFVRADGPGTADGTELRHFWTGTDNAEIVVLFFNDKVSNKGWATRPREPVLGKIRRLLHLN